MDNADALERGRAHFLAGMECLDAGDFRAAAQQFEAGLQHVPGRSSLLANLALARWRLGEVDRAAELASQVLAQEADDLSALMTLALCRVAQGRAQEALALCDRALGHAPEAAVAWCNRGQALAALQRPQDALESFDRARTLDPQEPLVWSNRALVLSRLGRREEALDSVQQALALDPASADAWTTLGETLNALGRITEALQATERALALDPAHTAARLNRAKLLADLHRDEEALAGFDALLREQPGHAEAEWNRALLLLEQGAYGPGWAAYEARWRLPDFEAPRHAELPCLPDLQSARGRRVLVCCEQGLGDVIQFSRFVPLLRGHAAAVGFEVPSSLLALMRSLAGDVELLAMGQAPLRSADFDWRIPLMSLPALLGTTLETLPAPSAYLQAPAVRVAHWRERLGPRRPGVRRVALACSGNPRHPQDCHRSAALALFLPLAAEVEILLVQRELKASDAPALEAGGLRWLGPELEDLADTAAVLTLCDLVISVDTALAHLAGALGCPTWVLLADPHDWRWLRAREDSPWYASLRLVRQSTPGDWAGVLAQVLDDLQTAPRAAALARRGHFVEAVRAFDRAVALEPQNPGVLAGRASARLSAHDPQGARADFYQVLALRPDDAHARRMLALIGLVEDELKPLQAAGRLDAAVAALDRAIAADPGSAALRAYRGVALSNLHRYPEALAELDLAVTLEPADVAHLANRGMTRLKAGDLAGARADFDAVLARRPGDPEVRISRAMLLLAEGDFQQGWPAYEARLESPELRHLLPVYEQPLWDGTPDLSGRTLLLWAEQGLGDSLQFAACIPRVQRLGAKVLLRVPATLKPLMRSLQGLPGAAPVPVYDEQEALPPFDLHCGLPGLPYRLGIRLQDLPLVRGYLAADPQQVQRWRTRLGPARRPRIGLVWSGNPKHLNDRNRSLPLHTLLAALPPDFEYHVVQKSLRPEELALLRARPEVVVHAEALRDFADTAALLQALDGLVTVDTSVAHLAGALGLEFQLLLPFRPDFRWFYGRSDSPWYPGARLWRQDQPGDWSAPLDAAFRHLRARLV